jgi:cytochrome c biogenesis protein CcmG/thiol:disulfide interchange protein DsbE
MEASKTGHPAPSRPARVWLAALAVTLPVVALLAYGFTRNPRTLPSPLIGRPAPVFRLAQFDGGVIDTAALRGRVLVINFWASWCYPACYEEAPRLQRLWEAYQDRGVVVIGVNIQDQDGPARAFIRQFRQTFPNAMDRTGQVAIDFGVYGVPETFVVDQEGRIAGKYDGAVTEEWLLARIAPLLSTPPRP